MYKVEDIVSIEQLDKYFLINWHITGWCNYHCSYCINKEFGTKYTPLNTVLKIAEAINKYINTNLKNQRVQLRLIGGEPTYYDLPIILDKIEHLDRLTVVTNFSRDTEFFKKMYIYCANRKLKFFLICSYHEENKEFIKKVAELTNWCRESHEYRMIFLRPQVSLLATKSFSKKILDDYLNEGIDRIRISILRDEKQNHINLSKEQLDIIYDWNKKYDEIILENYKKKNVKDRGFLVTYKDGSYELFVNATHLTNKFEEGIDPTGFYCSSGLTNMVVLPNGDVIINKCDYWKDVKWGNILKNTVQLPKNNLLCPITSSNNKTKCTLCSGVNLFRLELDNELDS